MEYLNVLIVLGACSYVVWCLHRFAQRMDSFQTYLQEISGVTPSEVRLIEAEKQFDLRVEEMREALLTAAERADERKYGRSVAEERDGVKNIPHHIIDYSDVEEIAL